MTRSSRHDCDERTGIKQDGDIASGIPVAVGVGFAEPTTDVEAQIIPRETMGDSDEEYSEEDYEYEYSDEDGGAGDEDVSMDGSFDAADAMILTSPSVLNDLELGVDETPLSSSSSSRPDDDYPRFNPPDANGNDDYEVNGTSPSSSFSSSSPSSSQQQSQRWRWLRHIPWLPIRGGPPCRFDAANEDSTPPNHENDATPICPICLNEDLTSTAAVVLSACQHQSCRACLAGWIREQSSGRNTGPSCPFCRVAICEEDVVKILGRVGGDGGGFLSDGGPPPRLGVANVDSTPSGCLSCCCSFWEGFCVFCYMMFWMYLIACTAFFTGIMICIHTPLANVPDVARANIWALFVAFWFLFMSPVLAYLISRLVGWDRIFCSGTSSCLWRGCRRWWWRRMR
jgi:hypothetical protein